MSTVTRESLAVRIEDLESRQSSIKEDFQLEAYRMLLKLMNGECTHEWLTCAPVSGRFYPIGHSVDYS